MVQSQGVRKLVPHADSAVELAPEHMAKLAKVTLKATRDSAQRILTLEVYAMPGDRADGSAMAVEEASDPREYAVGSVFHARLTFDTSRSDAAGTSWLIRTPFGQLGPYEDVVLTLGNNVVAIAKVIES